jgi:tRNA threonylcarbamoyl adenosine modification protein YeaZ
VLLALDTSSPVVTVAVADPAGDHVLAAASMGGGLRHGELLAPAIRSVLAEARVRPSGLTAIVVGAGPGPFTGLRVGLVTARTMADLLGIEAVGVCSLDIIARETQVPGPIAVATDARRKEIYWAVYDAPAADGSRRRIEGPAVDKPAAVAHVLGDLPLVGHGALLYADVLGHRFVDGGPEHPSAAVLAQGVLDGSLELIAPSPLYLRRPDVTLSAGPKSVLT